LFGGTFDPIHLGHVKTVAALQKDLEIDQIRWILSAQPPHRDQPQATIEQRLTMLDIALQDYPNMISDDVEVRSDKASYTIETLIHFRQKYPKASINLIVGSDIMQSFHHWHRDEDILKFANIIVMHRAGYSNDVNPKLLNYVTENMADLKSSAFGHVFVYAAPPVPISATQIRQAIANMDDVSDSLHSEVHEFIQQNNLYVSAHHFQNQNSKTQPPLFQTKSNEDIMIETQATDQADFSAEPIPFNSEEQVQMIVEALEDNKALDIKVLNITDISNFADYMVIATGTSNTHLRAISGNSVRELSRQGLKALGEEGRDSNEWVLADFGDVVVHIMRPEVRELYDLEKLWDPEVRKALAENES